VITYQLTKKASAAYVKLKLKGGPNPIRDFLSVNRMDATIGFQRSSSIRWVNFTKADQASTFAQVFAAQIEPDEPVSRLKYQITLRLFQPGDQAAFDAAVLKQHVDVQVEFKPDCRLIHCAGGDLFGLTKLLIRQVL
jgi:hypothetical protein